MAVILTDMGINKKIVYFEGDSGEERRIAANSAAYCSGHCVGLGGDKVGVQTLSKSVRSFLA